MTPSTTTETMAPDRRADVTRLFDETIQAHTRFRDLDHAPVLAAADAMFDSFMNGGKVLAFGNGGSAADAQHLSAELVGRFVRERRALPAIALSTDTSILTAVSNDYGYDRVFVRQIEALGREGDVAIGISTSGASPNVLEGLRTASVRRLRTVALTGRDGGAVGAAADIHINVPESSTALAQEVHGAILHVLCALIDDRIEAASTNA